MTQPSDSASSSDLSAPASLSSAAFSPRDRIYLGALLLLAFFVGACGIVHLGYIGQDFPGIQGHNHLMRAFPNDYAFAKLTNPPGLYILGNVIFRCLTTVYYLEILATILLLMNLGALWLMFRVIWETISAWQLRYAAAALITFMPFRTIHAIVAAGDTFTLPFFAVTAVLAVRLYNNPRIVAAWIGVAVTLGLSLVFKYTFVGVMATLAPLLALRIWKEVPGSKRWIWLGVEALAFAVPTCVFVFEVYVRGVGPNQHWKPPQNESVMRWHDILTLEKKDYGIFEAPQYFKDKLYDFRKYSYMALVHLAVFTDCQNYFQRPPKNVSENWRQRYNDGFDRDRDPRSHKLEQWSVAWCLPYSALAIGASLVFLALATHGALWSRHSLIPPAAIVIVVMAWGFFSPIYFNLHRVGDPYTAGYFTPRLILPALISFFILGYSLFELVVQRLSRVKKVVNTTNWVFLVHTAIACGLFIGFLT